MCTKYYRQLISYINKQTEEDWKGERVDENGIIKEESNFTVGKIWLIHNVKIDISAPWGKYYLSVFSQQSNIVAIHTVPNQWTTTNPTAVSG